MLSFPFSTGAERFAADLGRATRELVLFLPPCQAAHWLVTRSPALGGASPVGCLRAGDVARVHDAIDAACRE